MGALGKRHRRSKRLGSNPYAERGLDKFALVSAELAAKRERLVAQFGTSLSLVRFVIGSDQRNWIPVIVCPTLSKAEKRTLKRMATSLITEDRPAVGTANANEIHTPGRVSNSESNMQASSHSCYEIKDVLAHDGLSTHIEDAQTGCQTVTLSYLLSACERFIWMAAFTFSIAADAIRSAFLSKCLANVAPPKRILQSTRKPKEDSDINPYATMASSMHFSSLPPIRTPTSMSAKDIKVITPSHSGAHVEAPKTQNSCKNQGFSTAPSTPRDSRQTKKSFHASVSFPMTSRLRDDAPPSHSGITKKSKFLKSVSLPKTSQSHESNSQGKRRSPTSTTAKETVSKKGRKESSEKLGHALTGAGLALGLGGLVMGYIPAIVCIVCWWYALPSLRKAVGDKPYVKNHHL